MRALRGVLSALLATVMVLWGAGLPAYAADTGYVGPVYGTSTTAPTGQKPQSKLWYADGIWWGALFDGVSKDFHIFRYDWAANGWSDTGVLVDERTNVYLDALWDGQHLYVVSAGTWSTTESTNTTRSPRLLRFSYNAGTNSWSRDPGYPVTPMGNGGVEAAVIAKDSTGLIWATYTQGSKVYVAHSTLGDDLTWVPRYQVPTPAGESSVDPDDISAIVSYDGDKIGVLWSNQVLGVETMYWAWHQDGTPDGLWNLQIAYQRPEGADDHINLKSLTGDSSGRVFAVAKTSLNALSDPLINLLVLNTAGGWSATQVWTKADDSTRAIVQIDTQARELYVFAAGPCCSGGTVYYKKAALDNPQFASGLGTPFIHSGLHPEANNPTSTKQNVDGTTGLVVLAGDDQTRTYLYNRMTLGGAPVDNTAPETTITSGPAATTTATGATFAFTSTEPGSTFACALDGAPSAACTSPKSYAGLGVGTHTFEVAATDSAGNADLSPATFTWSVEADTTAPETTITSGPAATTTATGATFAFTSTEPGSTFACALDGSLPTACTSPKSYAGLSVGTHTFTVAATDSAGNADLSPALHSWSVEADTTPPETTITSSPAATTTATGATFAFTSNEPGSTFACALDGAPPAACTSPKSYAGLSVGTHNFTVAATDSAGNADLSPALHSWSVEVVNILSDDFSSGTFTAGGWEVKLGGNGTATVASGAVYPDNLGARLLSTSSAGSTASLRKPFAPQQSLTLSWDAKVEAHTGQAVALAKIYSSSGRVLSLVRAASGALSVMDVSSTVPINASLPTTQVARFTVAMIQGTTDSVTISINGVEVYSSSTLNLGSSAFNALRLGDDAKRRPLDYRIDNVQVTS